MPDMSQLDTKYFVDSHRYNCPFCRRRHVSYQVVETTTFDWDDVDKRCGVYFVKCESCGCRSMHLSFEEKSIIEVEYKTRGFKTEEGQEIDDLFFFSQPRSVFSLDERIPKVLRDLLWEAEGSLKSNFLTGASATARKVVYELARIEGANGDNYDDRIKSLKKKLPEIDPSFFDTLLTIQQVTSDKVHEDAYDGWESKHLRGILATLNEVVNEVYVVPKVKEERRKGILKIKKEILGAKPGVAPKAAAPAKPRVETE